MTDATKAAFKIIADPIVFGNFFISLCAASMVLESYLLMGHAPVFDALTFVVFFSTLALYNFHRLMGIRRIKAEDEGLITGWASKNQFTLLMLVVIGIGGTGFFAFQLTWQIFFALFPMAAISILYELPLVKYNKRFHRIRNLWLSKAFLITAVWAVTTAVLPALNVSISLADYGVILMVVERAIFIFILALCFDARDVEFDRRDSLKTIPIVYGEERTRQMVRIFCSLFFIITLVHYIILDHYWGTGAAMLISILLTYFLVMRTFPRRSDYYYMFLIDGMMMVQFLLTALLARIH